jgi:hypothetical protein
VEASGSTYAFLHVLMYFFIFFHHLPTYATLASQHTHGVTSRGCLASADWKQFNCKSRVNTNSKKGSFLINGSQLRNVPIFFWRMQKNKAFFTVCVNQRVFKTKKIFSFQKRSSLLQRWLKSLRIGPRPNVRFGFSNMNALC